MLSLKILEKASKNQLAKETKINDIEIIKLKKIISNYDKHLNEFNKSSILLIKSTKKFSNFLEKNLKIDYKEKGILFVKKIFDYYFKSSSLEKNFFNFIKNQLKLKNDQGKIINKLDFSEWIHESDLDNKDAAIDLWLPSYDNQIGLVGMEKYFNIIGYKNNIYETKPKTLENDYSLTDRTIKLFDKISTLHSLDSEKNENDVFYSRYIVKKSVYQRILDKFELNNRKIELILRARKKGREKMENVGYVYVLYNDAYPNTYKIGSTYGLPEERAEELTGTGHLTPFKVVAKYKTQSAEYYEKITHKLLKKSRVKKNREFFKLELNKIRDCLKQVTSISENGEKKIKFNTLKNRINF